MPDRSRVIYGRIRKYILTSMILVPLIPFIVILAIGYSVFSTTLEERTIESMKRIVSDHRRMIDTFLEERQSDLIFVSGSYSYDEIIRPDIFRLVYNRLKRKSVAFADLGVFDENGVHVMYEGPFQLAGKIYRDADWFKEVIKKGYYISDVYLGYRRTPHFIISYLREEGHQKWVIRTTIDTFMFNDLVEKVRIGRSGEAYLVNDEGRFQSERRSGGNLMETDPEFEQYPRNNNNIHTFIMRDSKGEEHLYKTIRMKNKNWLLVVRQQTSDVFSTLRKAVYLVFFIILLGGGAIVGVAFYLTNRIVQRIETADSEKNRLQDQLIRAGRLAELGEMAAGFAHEINNPLQIMKSEQALIESILEDFKEKKWLRENDEDVVDLEDSIQQISLQISRCSEITHSILKFGRKTESELQDIQLQNLIPEITGMVQKKADVHGINIKLNIPADIPPIFGDPSQVQQVLLNLFNNAMDAVLEKHGSAGGELTVEAGPNEGGVEIRVSDNGRGISPENLNKVFSPFFTTKPVGEGTGLGLSICYGIIQAMGGSMEVSSEQGVGSTFTVHLPGATG